MYACMCRDIIHQKLEKIAYALTENFIFDPCTTMSQKY